MSNGASEALTLGTQLGRYELIRRLGAGGMGEVFEARHLDLGKAVAIKTLHGAVAIRADVRARFLREGQAAARIRHPNAVDVTDVGVADGVAYLVMEMLHGEDLQALLRRERMLAPDRIASILLPTLSALSAAHEEGIVHRDLKPANIFLHRARDGSFVPKVLDFGISKMHVEDGAALTGTSALLGTPAYMSPEQLMSTRDVDVRSDIYSMGVILYECATGTMPFRGDTPFMVMSAVSTGVYVPPRQIRADIPEALEQVILRAMSRDPALRFDSARALAEALLPFAAPSLAGVWSARVSAPPGQVSHSFSISVDSPTKPIASPSINTLSGNTSAVTVSMAPPTRPRRIWPVLVGAALVIVGVGGGLIASNRGPNDLPSPQRSEAVLRNATSAPPPRSSTAGTRPPPQTVRVPRVEAPTVQTPTSVPAPALVVAAPPPSVLPAPNAEPAPRAEEHRHRSRRRSRDSAEPSTLGVYPVLSPTTAPSHAVGTNAMPVVR